MTQEGAQDENEEELGDQMQAGDRRSGERDMHDGDMDYTTEYL